MPLIVFTKLREDSRWDTDFNNRWHCLGKVNTNIFVPKQRKRDPITQYQWTALVPTIVVSKYKDIENKQLNYFFIYDTQSQNVLEISSYAIILNELPNIQLILEKFKKRRPIATLDTSIVGTIAEATKHECFLAVNNNFIPCDIRNKNGEVTIQPHKLEGKKENTKTRSPTTSFATVDLLIDQNKKNLRNAFLNFQSSRRSNNKDTLDYNDNKEAYLIYFNQDNASYLIRQVKVQKRGKQYTIRTAHYKEKPVATVKLDTQTLQFTCKLCSSALPSLTPRSAASHARLQAKPNSSPGSLFETSNYFFVAHGT